MPEAQATAAAQLGLSLRNEHLATENRIVRKQAKRRSRLSDSEGISLAEIADFGTVGRLPTPATDTDGDGGSDWAELVAGSNPTNASSALLLSASFLSASSAVKLSWPSGVAHGYRVLGSANGTTWSPFTDWLRATNYTTAFTLPARTNGAPYLFRIEAAP